MLAGGNGHLCQLEVFTPAEFYDSQPRRSSLFDSPTLPRFPSSGPLPRRKHDNSLFSFNPYFCSYCSMEMTIDLPEDVLTKAKIVAATRRATLR